MEEIWHRIYINDEESKYKISNTGKVYSDYTNRELTPVEDKDGYLIVCLRHKGRQWNKKIHRLVLEAFEPVYQNKDNQVNHKDGNKKRNYLDNLEWSDNSEQQLHAVKLGLSKPRVGEANNFATQTEEVVRSICQDLEDKVPVKEIAKRHNVTTKYIARIRRKERWKHIVCEYNF